jgi:ribosomal protein S4
MKSYKIYKDSSLITKEIYVKRSQLPKKRNNSTFNVKKVLKDRELDVSSRLLNIVFSSGFANSLCEAKHIILNGHIELNNKIVLIPDIKLKSGDIVTSNYSKTLLNYYNRR